MHKGVLMAENGEDWTSFLHRVSIFAELEDDALKEVAKKLNPLPWPRGAVVYREGDPGDALYLIQSGRVRKTTRQEDGTEKVSNILGRGDAFGESTLLTGARRTVTAKVDSDA